MTNEQWLAYRERQRKANRENMVKYRLRKRREHLLAQAKCPVCTMSLDPLYDAFHHQCPYWKENHKEIIFIRRVYFDGYWIEEA